MGKFAQSFAEMSYSDSDKKCSDSDKKLIGRIAQGAANDITRALQIARTTLNPDTMKLGDAISKCAYFLSDDRSKAFIEIKA